MLAVRGLVSRIRGAFRRRQEDRRGNGGSCCNWFCWRESRNREELSHEQTYGQQEEEHGPSTSGVGQQLEEVRIHDPRRDGNILSERHPTVMAVRTRGSTKDTIQPWIGKEEAQERFRHIADLGSGSYGEVSLVEDMVTRKIRALKISKDKERKIMHALREIKIMRLVGGRRYFLRFFHAYLQKTGTNDFECGTVMEYYGGRDLYESSKEQRFSSRELRSILRQLGQALYYLHRKAGIIHRDIRSENVLVNCWNRIKVIDFGSSVFGPWAVGIAGTPKFMAPEVYRKDTCGMRVPYGYAVDYYSVGAILYDLLSGFPPPDKVIAEYIRGVRAGHAMPTLRLPSPVRTDEESLLRALLHPLPDRRLDDVSFLRHPYFA